MLSNSPVMINAGTEVQWLRPLGAPGWSRAFSVSLGGLDQVPLVSVLRARVSS